MKKSYHTPQLEKLGTFENVTRVGETNPGNDIHPGGDADKDGGSILNPQSGG